jgi:hypothetical protein
MGGWVLSGAGVLFAASAVAFAATVVAAVRVEVPRSALGRAGAAEAGPAHVGPAEAPTRPGITPAPEERAGAAAAPVEIAPPGESYPGVTAEEIREAVGQDLFRPDRMPPPQPYLFPTERTVAAPERQEERRRGPELRVVGAAVMGEGGMALVQVGDTFPLALMVGETVEGYVLASVDADFATLVREEETLTLPVVEPLTRGASGSARAGSQRGQVDQRGMEQLQQRVQDMLRGMMQGGGRGGAVQVPQGMIEGGPASIVRLPDGSIQIIRGGAAALPPGAQLQVRRPGGGGGNRP